MSKSIKYVLSLASITTLVSCGQAAGNSSAKDPSNSQNSFIESALSSSSESFESSISSFDSNSISFSQAISLLEAAKQEETASSNEANKKTITIAGDIVDTDVEKVTIYDDHSSSSTGSVVETDKGVEINSDTYKTVKTVVTDKIEVNSVVNDYPMFVSIKDYDKDTYAKSAFQDRISKQYIVASANEATEGGLTDSSLYVLSGEVNAYESGLVASDLETFLYTGFIGNQYASATKLDITKNPDGTSTYSVQDSYSYDGDLNDVITESYSAAFTMNEDSTKLLSTSYTVSINDVSNSDATDVYVTGSSVEATLSYDVRGEKGEVLNPDDYFLATLNDIELLGSLSSGREIVDSSAIPSNATYLFANALDYSPAKACNTALTPVSSSNASVVEYSDGYLKVLGEGKTTLSFNYFGKENGVYKERSFEKEVTVVAAQPESVYIFSPTPDIEDNCIMQGQSYTYSCVVSPSKASQEIVVSSSDSNIISVSVNANNDIVVTGVNPGTATITVAAKANPNIKYEKTLTVQSSEIDFAKYITTKTYKSYDLYNYYFTMTFNADGTGVRIQYETKNKVETGKKYTDPFTYTIKDNVITFKWTTDYKDYPTGTITNNGNTISCSCDEDDDYSSYTFKAQ